jgi:hypothetical protein
MKYRQTSISDEFSKSPSSVFFLFHLIFHSFKLFLPDVARPFLVFLKTVFYENWISGLLSMSAIMSQKGLL